MITVQMVSVIVVLVVLAQSVRSCRHATIMKTGVTPYEKQQILESHNKLRQTVATGHINGQPMAENMQEMKWDDELASKAQYWANQCGFQHDPNRYLKRFIMGQNLALIWSTIPLAEDDGDFPSRIEKWFNEVQKYAWGSRFSMKTGHYSQLVWGDTNLVGCGFSYYYDSSNKYNKLFVCNYGPGGNVVGSMPYETGRPSCQNYGLYPSAKYSGLCVSELDNYNTNNNNNNNYYDTDNNIIPQNDDSYYRYKNYGGQQQQQQQQQHHHHQQPNQYSIKNAYNQDHSYVQQQPQQQPSPSPPATYNGYYQQPQPQPKYQSAYQQQPQQKPHAVKPVDQLSPFLTYRWDLLFKNVVNLV